MKIEVGAIYETHDRKLFKVIGFDHLHNEAKCESVGSFKFTQFFPVELFKGCFSRKVTKLENIILSN